MYQTCCHLFSDSHDAVPDCAPTSPLKKRAEVPPAAVHTVSSGTPVGRRGRLANLAATIGTWEDDLSHANIPKESAKEKPASTVPKSAVRDAAVAASTKPGAAGHVAAASMASSKFTPSSQVHLTYLKFFFFSISSLLFNRRCCFNLFFNLP